MNYNSPQQIYTDSMLGSILRDYSTDSIVDIINESISNFRIQAIPTTLPNLVTISEAKYNDILANFPMERDVIINTRLDTYKAIVKTISDRCDLGYDIQTDNDIYTVAYYLYDIFVSNFQKYIVDFYASYIANEAKDIMAHIPKEEIDNVIIHRIGKPPEKVSSDELTYRVISDKLYQIIYDMSARDITFDIFLDNIVSTEINPAIKELLTNSISVSASFFRDQISNYVLDDANAQLLNYIRIALQSYLCSQQIPRNSIIR